MWVDALRSRWLVSCRLLKDDFELEIQPAMARQPSPRSGWRRYCRKRKVAKVLGVGGGKLALEIDGKVIKDRRDRVAFLKEMPV